MKISRTIIWFVFCLLLTLQIARSLGGTEPTFEKNTLLRGETSKFYFDIFNYQSDKQDCSYSISGLDPLTITFDKEKTTINEHSTGRIFGTLSVPSNADIKAYKGIVSVSCSPQVELKIGGSVVSQSFSVPFSIYVVAQIGEGERVVTNIPQEKSKASPIILVLIIIVLILAIVGFYFSRKKKTE
jgi:hypothetical protein